MWSEFLKKEFFGSKKIFNLRCGSGVQKMSVLARLNLIDFIEYWLIKKNAWYRF